MPCSRTTLSLSDAKRMLAAGEAEAASVGIAYNIAVVDQGWRACSICDLAIGKALTARLFNKTTVSGPVGATRCAALRHRAKQWRAGHHLQQRSAGAHRHSTAEE